MREKLLSGWNFMRIFRLALAITLIIQAAVSQDGFFILIALFLLFQVITNTGCCSTNSCSSSSKTK